MTPAERAALRESIRIKGEFMSTRTKRKYCKMCRTRLCDKDPEWLIICAPCFERRKTSQR